MGREARRRLVVIGSPESDDVPGDRLRTYHARGWGQRQMRAGSLLAPPSACPSPPPLPNHVRETAGGGKWFKWARSCLCADCSHTSTGTRARASTHSLTCQQALFITHPPNTPPHTHTSERARTQTHKHQHTTDTSNSTRAYASTCAASVHTIICRGRRKSRIQRCREGDCESVSC